MAFSFNLLEEAWIPCLLPDGVLVELGVYDALIQAHQLREIRGDTPLETAALHRLLLAVLHRVFGPSGATEWKKLWQLPRFDVERLAAYLHDPAIFDGFDLFHPIRPFYQPRKMVRGEITNTRKQHKGKQTLDELLSAVANGAITDNDKTSIGSLVIHAASGNNATLFDHTTEDAGMCLTPSQTARSLVTSQAFGLSGTNSTTTNFADGPAAKGILFLNRGNNLYETLLLNLVRYGEDIPLATPTDDDIPAWEMDDPFVPNRTQPKGYLDYLTWHNRRIWLFPERIDGGVIVRQMVWAPGLTLEVGSLDPMKHYTANDKQTEMQPLCFTSDRALWRDSSLLLEVSATTRPSHTVRWLAGLAQPPHSILDKSQRYQLMAFGLAKSQASLEFMRAERLPLSTSFFIEPNRVSDLSRSLQSAEHTAAVVRRAAFLLAWLLLAANVATSAFDMEVKIDQKIAKGRNPKGDDRNAQNAWSLVKSWGVERYFWSELEPFFHRLIQDLPDEPNAAVQTWQKEVRRAAIGAFEHAERNAGSDLRAQRSVAVARQLFNQGLVASLGKTGSLENSSSGGETV